MPRRVLVVIDDPLLTELVLEALADRGHLAYDACDVDQVTALLHALPIEAAIVDLDVRGVTREPIVAAVRAHAPGARVIALLPCGGAPSAGLVESDGAFEKPVRLSELMAFVDGARR